jgi:DNA-binding MarR family transcriptional regulator
VAVALTAAGHEVIERSVDAVLERDSELVAGLTAEEQAVVIPLLDKLEAFVRARSASATVPPP